LFASKWLGKDYCLQSMQNLCKWIKYSLLSSWKWLRITVMVCTTHIETDTGLPADIDKFSWLHHTYWNWHWPSCTHWQVFLTSPHILKLTLAFLRTLTSVHDLSEPLNWLSNSPDLNPVDYSIWVLFSCSVSRSKTLTAWK